MSDETPPLERPADAAGVPKTLTHALRRLEAVGDRLRLLEKALSTMQVGVTITNRRREIVYANPAEAAMHGYAADEVIGRDAAMFAPTELRNKPLSAAGLGRIKSWRRESVNMRKDGTTFPVEILSDVVVAADGKPWGIVSICQDIGEQVHAKTALRKSKERFALAVRGANDGLWDWDFRTGRVYFSPRWKAMLGCDEEAVGSEIEEWFRRVHPDDLERLRSDLDAHLAGETEHFQNEHRMLHGDESYRWMLSRGLAVVAADGKPVRMAGSQTDITDRKVHDPLTGLPNRALLLDRLDSALARSVRHQDNVAVLFLDVDRFKVINDSLGHIAGDHLLIELSRRLETCLRAGDTVARLGGDEFTILLDEIRGVARAEQVSERIHQSLEAPFRAGGQEVFATVSIGIAVSATGREKSEDLLRDADTAMYRAKSLGRGRHQIFDQDMRTTALEQLRLETDLRHAMERRELRLVYQPILSFPEERIIGFEALARWRHPQRGLVLPEDFIPVAEETGLILPIGRWVLEEACRQLRRWHLEFPSGKPLTVSVNLSPRQFSHPDLVSQVERALNAAGLQPRHLELEITESVFMANPEPAIEVLERLREMGVQVCVDDFGTGYSSLAYLSHFKIDALKIDRSFVSRIDRERRQGELVQAIINMARELRIGVVAEGVETAGQLALLKTMSCPYMQGFCFGKPVSPRLASALLRRRPGEPLV